MNGSTKILTVSYGTFSCTLEGFDDPLGSMREMAEYFRDLAADDRYFGAEPPTPDVEMLQRIAEKEVQRRVEARVTDTGVALVAADPAPVAEPAPAPDPAPAEAEVPADRSEPVAAASGSGPLTYDDDFLMSDEPEDVLPVDPNARVDASGPAESVAEKLRRIRAVVSRNMEADNEAMRREQAPNADDPELRERALSKTIQQIQADLSEDEDEPVAADLMPEAAEAPVLTDDAATEDEPDDIAIISADWDLEPELLGDFEKDAVAASPEPTKEAAPETDEESDAEASDPKPARSVSEMLGSVSQRVAENSTEDHPELAVKVRDTSRTLTPEPEADVGRLLNETDSKLNDNETVRRRRVISQMRAAVAATKADRLVSQQSSREAEEEAEKDLYREDLSEAVEDAPVGQAEEQQAATSRVLSSPPLVLVSSQRIDSEPVGQNGNVADFAARFGAKELPELMEAAAAFTIFSEGQPSFTRPEIMQMVTRMDPSLQLSREESLRSFGQLLREGTFKKLERGQFTIDHDTKYNPEQRVSGA